MNSVFGGLVATLTFDSKGRIMCISGNVVGFRLLLIDADTLEILAETRLPQRPSTIEAMAFRVKGAGTASDNLYLKLSVAAEGNGNSKFDYMFYGMYKTIYMSNVLRSLSRDSSSPILLLSVSHSLGIAIQVINRPL